MVPSGVLMGQVAAAPPKQGPTTTLSPQRAAGAVGAPVVVVPQAVSQTPFTGVSQPPGESRLEPSQLARQQFARAEINTPPIAVSTPVHPTREARVKDIASIEGIRDNQLVGYGIVVGLQNTGDSQQTAFPIQTLAATLLRMGVSVPAASIRVQNLAAVFISATLPPFARPGTKLDITVSSAGDAKSLEGGLLLMTPLYGPDGKIYAQAQGPLVVGGYSVSANGNVKQVNFPTTARVPLGGDGGAWGAA